MYVQFTAQLTTLQDIFVARTILPNVVIQMITLGMRA
jgi:hypothetical protein